METTTTPKRTYQKHKTEGKITVKHYLNTKLKPSLLDGENFHGKEYFPVYVQVTVKGQSAQFKSKTNIITTKQDFENNIWNEKSKKELKQEIEDIVNTIKYLKPFEKEDFKIVEFTNFYDKLYLTFWKVIDEQLKGVIWVQFDRYLQKAQNTQSNLGELQMMVLKGIDWKADTIIVITLINFLCPDFIKEVKGIFKTPYLFDLKSLNTPPSCRYTDLTLADYQAGRYQQFVLDHLGTELGKAFLDDIDKVVELYKEYKNKNILDNYFI